MSAKKLLSPTALFRPIPSMVMNSLLHSQDRVLRSNPSSPLKGPSILATSLVKSYAERGLIEDARKVFDEMPERDVVAWTVMISGYTSCNEHHEAWRVFCGMLRSEVDPNVFTLSSVLKACKGMKALWSGELVHALAIKRCLMRSVYVDNALMDVYATCSVTMAAARMVFEDIDVKSVVSWTTLIAGYTHRGDGYGGLRLFRQMLMDGTELNAYSFSIAARACASIGSHSIGKQIHASVVKRGFKSSLPVLNSVLDMYCKCGCLSEANQFFHEMTEKNLITWNTLISGYESSSCSSESLYIFSRMESRGFSPNCITYSSVTAACANLALLNCGQQIHGGIIHRGFDRNLALCNALIDMYAKCGSITNSCRIFTEMSNRNLLSWTSMMIGYGSHGYGKSAVELFHKMVASGVKPDRVVFMAILVACSHAGLVDEGVAYFKEMIAEYKVVPDQEIYGCVVDLLGRAGRIEEAYRLIRHMPFEPDESVYCTLLGACKAHKLPNLAKLAAKRLLDLSPTMVGSYVMLSNVYAAQGKWSEYAEMRKLIRKVGNKKETGKSWIEVRNEVQSFAVGNKTSSGAEMACGVLETLFWHMRGGECEPSSDFSIHDLQDGILTVSEVSIHFQVSEPLFSGF